MTDIVVLRGRCFGAGGGTCSGGVAARLSSVVGVLVCFVAVVGDLVVVLSAAPDAGHGRLGLRGVRVGW